MEGLDFDAFVALMNAYGVEPKSRMVKDERDQVQYYEVRIEVPPPSYSLFELNKSNEQKPNVFGSPGHYVRFVFGSDKKFRGIGLFS
jgi:hypothetical protein